LKTRLLGLSIPIWLAQIGAIYLVKTELEFETSALPKRKNKEEKVDLEGKIFAPYLGLLIALPPFLKHGIDLFKDPK